MEDNSLLVIVLAFVLGCMCSGMMKQMCGGRLVEGTSSHDTYPYYVRPKSYGALCTFDHYSPSPTPPCDHGLNCYTGCTRSSCDDQNRCWPGDMHEGKKPAGPFKAFGDNRQDNTGPNNPELACA